MATNVTSLFPVSHGGGVYTEVTSNASTDFTMPSPSPNDERILQLEDQLGWTRFVVMCILVPIVITFGVTGNFLNIAVLTRRSMRSSTNCYLTCLAVYDVLYLVFVFTLTIKHYTDVNGLKWYNYYKYHVGIPVTNTCSNTSVWVTLTFTIERYIGVCHPIKGKALCTPQRAKYIILVVCTVAAIMTLPDFLAKTVVEKVTVAEDGTNITRYMGKATSMAERVSFSVGYSYMAQVLFTFMPLVLLMVFNSLLIHSVMVAAKDRSKMAQMSVVRSERQERQHRDQSRITIMLITVVIVFLLCQTPQAVQNILFAYYVHNNALTMERRLLFTITANIFNLFVIINSSANFILYSAFSTKFRRTFSRLFCRCSHGGKKRGDMLYTEATMNPPSQAGGSDCDSRSRLLQGGTNNRKPQQQLQQKQSKQPGVFSWSRPHNNGAVTRINQSKNNERLGPNTTKNGYSNCPSSTQNLVSCV